MAKETIKISKNELTEMVKKSILRTLNENSSIDIEQQKEETRNDYESVSNVYTKQEKLAYAQKYGVDSLKIADIERGILLRLRELRKMSNTYTKEDYIDFMRLENYVVKNLPVYLQEESPEFVNWLTNFYYETSIKGKIEGRGTYGMSSGDKFKLQMYNKMLEYQKSSQESIVTPEKQELSVLINKFTELLADYKEKYLKRVNEYAHKQYTVIFPNKIEELKERRNELKVQYDKLDWRLNRAEHTSLYNQISKLDASIDRYRKIFSKFTLEQYVEKMVDEARKDFEGNIKYLCEKIQEDGLVVSKLQVKKITDDPKVFNMKITDGVKNLYCRSVLAAVDSQFMIPHYRFIITNRTKGDEFYID